MCGILGIVRSDGGSIDPNQLQDMTDTMRHRGPDGRGFALLDPVAKTARFYDRIQTQDSNGGPSIGLGHRRLSIIDIEGGQQPMSNEDGSVWVVFNGEIYNFQELRPQLSALGHHFKTDHSDTETIVHAFEEWGERCLDHFRGMFAFGVVDLNRNRLFLARDRIGKKPLFYYAGQGKLIFASEIKAIIQDSSVPREVDLTALADYFTYLYIPFPKTIFKNIYKLNPGHFLSVDLNDASSACPFRSISYWDVRFEPDESISEAEWCERLRAELIEAIRIRMISDVPLGTFLSGGVDSSTVVALMSRLQDKPVKTFSIGFEEAGYDETPYARQVARQFGTDHHEEIIRPDAIEVLPKLAWEYDEPFADSSAVPTYYVSQMARKWVTVVLSGDGGDEGFAGYRRYSKALRFHHWVDWIPHFIRKAIFGRISRIGQDGLKGKKRLIYFSQEPGERFRSVVSRPVWRSLFRPEIRDAIGGDYENPILSDLWGRGGYDYVSRMQYLDTKTCLPEDMLTKIDRASMLNSLEVRCPFVDHKVIELAARIPSRLKLNRYDKKYILKRMMLSEFGHDFLYRRKWGFEVPVERWFRNDLNGYLSDTLLGANSFVSNYIEKGALHKVIKRHRAGLRDLSPTIWSVLFLEKWGEVYMKGKGDH